VLQKLRAAVEINAQASEAKLPKLEEQLQQQQQNAHEELQKERALSLDQASGGRIAELEQQLKNTDDELQKIRAAVEVNAKAASNDLRDARVESSPNALQASVEERPVTAQSESADQMQPPKSVEKHVSIDEVAAKDTTRNEDEHAGPTQMSRNEVPRQMPPGTELSHAESPQMSVLANLDRTAMRIEDRVSHLDSRLLLAYEAIEANKAGSDQRFNSMETHLQQITTTKLEYDDLTRRLQAVEKDGTAHQPKVASTLSSRGTRKAESSFGSPSFVSSPVALQDTDKRTVAAAMVMMEQRLEGYVTNESFNGLREHMQDGLENIGERIRSAHESQIQKTESMLTQLLETRRQRSRGGKRPKEPTQGSENDTTQPNTSSIESSLTVLPEEQF